MIPPLMVRITGGGSTFTAGQNHTLTCQVSGGSANMMASYQWLKNDGILSNQTSRNISFSPLKESDSGQYSCQATMGPTNKSDNVKITVMGKSAYFNGGFKISLSYSTELLSHHHK